MKRIIILALLIFVSFCSFSEGIKFEESSYKETLKEAEKQNKLVFIDVFTSWCGPCTHMANTVFTDDKVGEFFNKRFLCLKIDAETKLGKKLVKKYKIQGYPTCIFINGSEEMIYNCIGYKSTDAIIEEANKALLVQQLN